MIQWIADLPHMTKKGAIFGEEAQASISVRFKIPYIIANVRSQRSREFLQLAPKGTSGLTPHRLPQDFLKMPIMPGANPLYYSLSIPAANALRNH